MNIKNAAAYALILAVSAGMMAGCASFPISKELRTRVDKKLTFKKVLADPDAYKGSTVIWGGEIVQVMGLVQGAELIILDSPLDRGERPIGTQYSTGRFIATTDSFIDPAIYKENGWVTIGGVVTGKETRLLSKSQYRYPVIDIKEIHVWNTDSAYYYAPEVGYYWSYPWGWGGRHYRHWRR